MNRIATTTKTSTASLLILIAAGCTVGPDYKKPEVKVPNQYGAAGASEATTKPSQTPVHDARWWSTFHDPVLNSLVERAVQSNHDIRIAQARIREAREQRRIANSAFWPEVGTQGSYRRSHSSENTGGGGGSFSIGTGGTGGTGGGGTGGGTGGSTGGTAFSFGNDDEDSDLTQVGFDASWEIDVFGGSRRNAEASRADFEAQQNNLRNTLVTLLGDVATNYIQARGLQRQITLTRKNLKSQQDTLELTRSRFRAGLTSDLDVAQAEASVATTAAQLPSQERQYRQAVHRLGVLLGQEPNAVARELDNHAPIPQAPETLPVGLPSDLLRRRPDVMAAERQLAASTARIGVAVAELFPRFSLTGGLGLQSSQGEDLFEGDSLFWNIGPSVRWPIFSAGRLRANVRVEEARQEAALATYEQAVLRSLEDVENSMVAFEQEQVRRQKLNDAVEANRRAVSLANELYARGLGDFLDVLVAERALNAAEEQLAVSETTVSTNLVALYKALGGGWETFEPQPAANQPQGSQQEQQALAR